MATAWVLPGGASFGAAQVGLARALMEEGHDPDLLYGASSGALNAVWLAAEPTPEALDALGALWASVRKSDVFPFNPALALLGGAGLYDHTVNPARLRKWLRATCPLRRLEDGALPLTVVATDIATGEEVLLSEGPAVPALLASAAMPGIFPPVLVEERWLVDGSIAADSPLGAAVDAGATRIWVLTSAAPMGHSRPKTALQTVLRSAAIALARQNADVARAWCNRCELYVMPAPRVEGVSPFKFDKGAQLIEAAYRLAKEWLRSAQPVVAVPGRRGCE